MPRLGRVVLPNDPHHVVQRGHNKQPVFAEDADDRHDLGTLATFKVLLDIKVYAFCLMSTSSRSDPKWDVLSVDVGYQNVGAGAQTVERAPLDVRRDAMTRREDCAKPRGAD
jgi:hypothetical protein